MASARNTKYSEFSIYLRSALHRMQSLALLSKEFDEAMVLLLRNLVANFMNQNSDLAINGLPIQFAIDMGIYGTLENYLSSKVLRMGE